MKKAPFIVQKGLVLTTMLLIIILAGCGSSSDQETKKSSESNASNSTVTSSSDNPIVTITMEDEAKIEIELFPSVAPNTVNNFITLVQDGFYDGLTFHRVIPDFMIQGGDPNGDGTGDPGYSIEGEFSGNGVENNLKHERGVLSMARSQMPDSAGSQFFIMVADAPHLDGEYASFGKVVSGMDVVDKIVSVERDSADKPVTEVKMKEVTVDTKGKDYPKPETIDN
ncbi:peptidylprolyl isomerase [Bacillus sp. B1-b2]|uniref:peptidylprolyl isomerase n=1 Tax=Bacillus sp. B1-b2 TaxID=2653201 RepID=UPI00126189C4|nr:peptidylprolyl isomerase [Bacillus sp. B1-b2]KAB7671176.1 peptidylprolyl isomerase [Bacillus sp. B1-b2]